MLQLHPNFDMKALEALVMLEVVGEAVDEVEQVTTSQRAAMGVAGTSGGGATTKTGVSAGTIEVVKIEDAIDSQALVNMFPLFVFNVVHDNRAC